ncbi:DinB family protein [Desulfosporosinus meridiei]|uniref:DinB-like domain-containing protein n=1 Tax=Desulfosporosinus meridiei (strain ATCC BAA-275 / DSM 13257 / KCTC 12902 / NCIMB 13706 / S10) TaxID=768704 RepID=J7IXL5_DESMD|nr:DinB family protein [Desulfosporosinus meridiei]AFQ43838.1 hypothetical protein Desmer_1880 [Desulfosporosinus meridiei DSM 13257]
MTDKIIVSSAESIRKSLNFQFDISWQMLEYHLNNLGTEESLWRPATKGLHVVNESGTWHADWPDSEAYDIGPASLAWITWHIIFWWSMVLDFSFSKGTLSRENILWPGNMTATKERIIQLRDVWRSSVESLSDDDFLSCERTRWPFTDKPFYDLAGWLNLELMKNAAEIGYCRFLYATRKQ